MTQQRLGRIMRHAIYLHEYLERKPPIYRRLRALRRLRATMSEILLQLQSGGDPPPELALLSTIEHN